MYVVATYLLHAAVYHIHIHATSTFMAIVVIIHNTVYVRTCTAIAPVIYVHIC